MLFLSHSYLSQSFFLIWLIESTNRATKTWFVSLVLFHNNRSTSLQIFDSLEFNERNNEEEKVPHLRMSFKNERFLIEAIEQCQLQRIITCFKHGHNLHIHNELGQNVLVHLLKQRHKHVDQTMEKKRFHIFQFLVVHVHLSVQLIDVFGKNLINWASNLNCTDEALYLLRSYPGDIDILRRDNAGSCSLHYAIEHGNETLVRAMIEYLLSYRLRFDAKDAYNNTPEELARKLGYDHLAIHLANTSRSTAFLSREIPSYSARRPLTNKSKQTVNTKISLTSSSSTSASTSLVAGDPSEFYSFMESKIDRAKQLNDWKTVASLRLYQCNPHGRKLHQLRTYSHSDKPHHSRVERDEISAIPAARPNRTPSPVSSISLPRIHLRKLSTNESVRMLRLMEPQLTSSYRQAFVPHFERPAIPHIGYLSTANAGRKLSQASSRRTSTLPGLRRRESNVSQLGGLIPQDGHSRLSVQPGQKQHRPSVVSPRTSETDALAKLRAKHTVPVHSWVTHSSTWSMFHTDE